MVALPGLWSDSMILRIFSNLHDSLLFIFLFIFEAGTCKGRDLDHFVAFCFCSLLKYGITHKSCSTGVLCSTAPAPSPEVQPLLLPAFFFMVITHPEPCEESAGGVRAHQEQQSWKKTAFLMEKTNAPSSHSPTDTDNNLHPS